MTIYGNNLLRVTLFFTKGTLQGQAAPPWLEPAATNHLPATPDQGPSYLFDNAIWDLWSWDLAAAALAPDGSGWEAFPQDKCVEARGWERWREACFEGRQLLYLTPVRESTSWEIEWFTCPHPALHPRVSACTRLPAEEAAGWMRKVRQALEEKTAREALGRRGAEARDEREVSNATRTLSPRVA